MKFLNDYQIRRYGDTLEDPATRVRNFMIEMYEVGALGEYDPLFLMLFDKFSKPDGEKEPELVMYKYYFKGESMVDAGDNSEAPLIHGSYGYERNIIGHQARHARTQLTRSELKFKRDDIWKDKIKNQLFNAIKLVKYQISKTGLDMALNRGWEMTFIDSFGQTRKNLDIHGTNAPFAYNHTPNIPNCGINFKYSNLCVEMNAAGTNYIMNPLFSADAAMDTYQYSNSVKGMNGVPMNGSRNINTLILPERMMRELLVLTGSTHEVNSANNNINIFKYIINGIDGITSPELYTDGQGNRVNPISGKSYADYWYMVDLGRIKEELKFEIIEEPTIKEEHPTGNSEFMHWYTRPYFRLYITGHQYLFGSNATEVAAPADFPMV
ncbi:MAG: hypothetical protein E6R13_02625 [Spirochaetes bacterium]|nr:MAG: hypothetical protein E6R13_02625 [Spirochaetota bacterium]